MKKYTPGPWKVDEAENLPLAVIEDNEDGNGICEVGRSRSKENIANAYLISAAPDLLEALVKITGSYERLQEVFALKERNFIIEQAKEAIAKAKG